MGPKAAQLTKKKLNTSNHGLRVLGQSFSFKWGENISIGSLTIVLFKASSVIFYALAFFTKFVSRIKMNNV